MMSMTGCKDIKVGNSYSNDSLFEVFLKPLLLPEPDIQYLYTEGEANRDIYKGLIYFFAKALHDERDAYHDK